MHLPPTQIILNLIPQNIMRWGVIIVKPLHRLNLSLMSCYIIPSQDLLNNHSYNRNQQDALFIDFILIKDSTCFGQTYCPWNYIPTSLAT